MHVIKRQLYLTESMFGQRVDQAIHEVWDDVSRSRIQTWIQNNYLVRSNGTSFKPSWVIDEACELVLNAPEEAIIDDGPDSSIQVNVIHEDEHCIVLNKPAGLVVHPAAGHASQTLLNGLLAHCPSLAQLPRAGIVHRLDKDTTGIMVVAKSFEAHQLFVKGLQSREMSRVYYAVASNQGPEKGRITAPIGRCPRNRQKMAVVESGKEAVTLFKKLSAHGDMALYAVKLKTGRTHQIRVHFKHIGIPLLGDTTYGKASPLIERQALHAAQLSFEHPSGQTLTFEAPTADDFAKLIEHLSLGVE